MLDCEIYLSLRFLITASACLPRRSGLGPLACDIQRIVSFESHTLDRDPPPSHFRSGPLSSSSSSSSLSLPFTLFYFITFIKIITIISTFSTFSFA